MFVAYFPPHSIPTHPGYELREPEVWRQASTAAAQVTGGKCAPAPVPAAYEWDIQVRNGALAHRDVKNEDRSDYVFENKCSTTKCIPLNSLFCTKLHGSVGRRPLSVG